MIRKYIGYTLTLFVGLLNIKVDGQRPSMYLYHQEGVAPKPTYEVNNSVPVKVRIEAGLLFPFSNSDPHYTTGTQSSTGYLIGLLFEMPVLKLGYIVTGADYVNEGVAFNSYFFSSGNSFLYNDNFFYTHTISINELHIPLYYKFNLSSNPRKMKTFYASFGAIYRLILSDNSTVYNNQTGNFIWLGNNDMTFIYDLFSKKGSPSVEFSIGYQRNKLKTHNGYFIEFQYILGMSPINYTGNNEGSNSINFTLNTLSLKIGLRI